MWSWEEERDNEEKPQMKRMNNNKRHLKATRIKI
jgi:hypothetical protein